VISPESTSPSRIDQLWPEIAKAPSLSERRRRIADFLDCCEQVLQSPDRQARYHVFHQISYLLDEPVCNAEVWDWLQELARSADYERQVDMRIAVFELVPDPPIAWGHLFRLWDMWFDPRTRWAVYAAYHPFPRRLQQHLRRYIAHRRRHGLPVPEFSHEEFHAVLRRHAQRAIFAARAGDRALAEKHLGAGANPNVWDPGLTKRRRRTGATRVRAKPAANLKRPLTPKLGLAAPVAWLIVGRWAPRTHE
jgi:hypothetical protein